MKNAHTSSENSLAIHCANEEDAKHVAQCINEKLFNLTGLNFNVKYEKETFFGRQFLAVLDDKASKELMYTIHNQSPSRVAKHLGFNRS
ncbi:hypothetical protein ACQUW5_13075 [Legionella sp. CNM-1927-20]|uniref:hypothetical protein n=1 Tax=Legionella sp. CNM-1927-20 TaxID=3422221 RepID=UPI00403AC610